MCIYRVFDNDEDGSVSLDDMSSLFDALGMSFTTDEMKEMLLCGDSSGQMKVNFEGTKAIVFLMPVSHFYYSHRLLYIPFDIFNQHRIKSIDYDINTIHTILTMSI